MAAVARSRELDHKKAIAPTRGLSEEYWNTFNEPRRRILINLLVLSRLVFTYLNEEHSDHHGSKDSLLHSAESKGQV